MKKWTKNVSKKFNEKTFKQTKEPNRKRSVIVNFRMTPEEKEILNNRIRLSGLMKQNYMIKSVLNQKICVVGNKKVYCEISQQLAEIREDICKTEKWEDIDIVKLESLKMIAEIVSTL